MVISYLAVTTPSILVSDGSEPHSESFLCQVYVYQNLVLNASHGCLVSYPVPIFFFEQIFWQKFKLLKPSETCSINPDTGQDGSGNTRVELACQQFASMSIFLVTRSHISVWDFDLLYILQCKNIVEL